jgi:hypothetical protein
MSDLVKTDQPLRKVVGALNYLDEPASSDLTRGLEFHVPHDHLTNMRLRTHAMVIRDARPAVGQFDIESGGFCLAGHKLSLRDPTDVVEHNGANRHEIEEVVKHATGAARTFCIGVQLRFAETSPNAGTGFNSLPARFVHGDFKGEAGLGLFRLWPGFDRREHARVAVFNAWRVITAPPQDPPLAVCDARTALPEDSHDLTAVLEEVPGDPQRHHIAAYQFRPRHEWYYFSSMTPDELLIFKTYESDPARPDAVPHSAFDDNSFAETAVPRASAEARVLAVFD